MKYVDINFELMHETDLAVLITDGTKQGWVPKGCIEDGFDLDYEGKICLKEWI